MFVVFTDVFLEADESFSSVEGLWVLTGCFASWDV